MKQKDLLKYFFRNYSFFAKINHGGKDLLIYIDNSFTFQIEIEYEEDKFVLEELLCVLGPPILTRSKLSDRLFKAHSV